MQPTLFQFSVRILIVSTKVDWPHINFRMFTLTIISSDIISSRGLNCLLYSTSFIKSTIILIFIQFIWLRPSPNSITFYDFTLIHLILQDGTYLRSLSPYKLPTIYHWIPSLPQEFIFLAKNCLELLDLCGSKQSLQCTPLALTRQTRTDSSHAKNLMNRLQSCFNSLGLTTFIAYPACALA